MAKYYALHNAYGDETTVGLDNTNAALAFTSRANRDAFLERWQNVNRSVRPISREEALRYATREGGAYYVIDGEHYALSKDYTKRVKVK
jgi:hypothetical protein